LTRIPLDELFRRAVDVVEGERIPYLVYGGIAFPFWGRVVATDDVDIVVNVSEADADRLLGAFRASGFYLPPSAETTFVVDTWIAASTGGRDVDIALGTTQFDFQALERAVRVQVFGRKIPIPTAEDLILYKLVAHRRKDLAHVEDIITRQGKKLELSYLRRWAQEIAEATNKFEVPQTLDRMLSEQGL
jgi:hypothetical protein